MPLHLPQRQPSAARLAFVCDVPDNPTTVLSHSARHMLATTLATVGLSLDEALVASVWPAPAVLVGKLDWSAAAVQRSIMALLAALTAFRPNLVVLLGNDPKSPSHAALHLFKSGNVAPPTTKGGKVKWEWATGTWRGSLFLSSELLFGSGGVESRHPLKGGPVEPLTNTDKSGSRSSDRPASNLYGVSGVELDTPVIQRLRQPTVPQTRTEHSRTKDTGVDELEVGHDLIHRSRAQGSEYDSTSAVSGATPPDSSLCDPNDHLPSYVAMEPTLDAAPLATSPTPHAPGPLRVRGSNVQPTALAAAPMEPGAEAAPGQDALSLAAAAPSGGCGNELDSVATKPADHPACALPGGSVGRICDEFLPLDCGALVGNALSPESPCSGSGGVTVSDRRFKCMATWHPAFVNRAWSHYLTELRCDVRRMRDEATTATLVLDDCLIEWGPMAG